MFELAIVSVLVGAVVCVLVCHAHWNRKKDAKTKCAVSDGMQPAFFFEIEQDTCVTHTDEII